MRIQQLNFKAILWGFCIDTIGTLIFATMLIFAMEAAGIPAKEVEVRLSSMNGLMLMLITGLCFTLIGGYIAGRKAGQSEVLHGSIVAGLGVVLGLFFREPNLPLWYEVISIAAMVPIGMAGGFISKKEKAITKSV